MSDKDRKAFEDWFSGCGLEVIDDLRIWQAACEYKQDQFKFQTPPAVAIYQDMNEKIQDENKKLREALQSIGYFHLRPEQVIRTAREALKETSEE